MNPRVLIGVTSHLLVEHPEPGLNCLWCIFEFMIEMDTPPESRSSEYNSAKIMVEMYFKEPIINQINPLMYWKDKKVVWNGLAIMACKYLLIPPSSASSERSAADIISKERNRRTPERAEMLLSLKITYQNLNTITE